MSNFFSSLEKNPTKSTLLFLLLMASCISFRFDHILQNLGNEKVIEAWGDGLKTYTNAKYHIDHDAENHWFEAMNYPYGEHIIPATELPGIAMLMKELKPLFPHVSEYVVSVIHVELLLALLLCGLFLFLIFKQLKLPFWFATLAAIGLTFLAPQHLRMAAHYGLAQPFVIPLTLYFLLLFEKKNSYKISLGLGVCVFLVSFLHFYFLGINMLLVSLYFLFRFLQKCFAQKTEKPLQNAVHYAIQIIPHYFLMVVATYLFFYFWMMSRDPFLDRSPNPYGFLVYLSDWRGVFTWLKSPIWVWVDTNVRPLGLVGFEGRSYVGLIGGGFFFLLLLNVILQLFKRSFLPKSVWQNQFFQANFLAAFVLLLLSFGYPFVFEKLEFLMDYVGPLRQFRSMGRFAWSFYFVINILAFYGAFQWLKNKAKTPKIIGFITLFSILLFESHHFTNRQDYGLEEVDYWTKGEPFSVIDSIDFSNYQASIPIPYFNVASDHLNQGAGGFSLQKIAVLGNQTGIPTTGAMLTRNSISQTFFQWQLVLKPYRQPVILEDYKNEKPLIIVWFHNPKEDYFPKYGHLLEGAKSIFRKGELELFEMNLTTFEDRIISEKNSIQKAIQNDSLFQIREFLSTDSLENFVYEDFEDKPSEKAYLTAGAVSGSLQEEQHIFTGMIPNVQTDSMYHLQIWAWIFEDKMPSTKLILQEKDQAGEVLQKRQFHLWENSPKYIYTFDSNGWALIDFSFQPKAKDSQFTLSFVGNEPRDERVQYFDHLLIKPQSVQLFQETKTHWRRNNLWFEK